MYKKSESFQGSHRSTFSGKQQDNIRLGMTVHKSVLAIHFPEVIKLGLESNGAI